MKTQLDKYQPQSLEASVSENSDYFNFELWASEVRRQMLDSLQKKDAHREAKNQEKKLKQRINSHQT